MKLFRYSGSKARYLKHYRSPPSGTKRVVEPYLGSGAYMLSTDLPGLGYEVNGDIVSMWKWLQSTTPAELKDLSDAVEAAKSAAADGKPDVRGMSLDLGPQTYVRINVASVMVGQLASWKVYPQHSLPIEQTISLLPRLKDVEIVHGSANDYIHSDGDMLFVDPPYVGTTGNYVEKGKNHETSYDPLTTISLVNSTDNPIAFTYGDGASDIFPYKWEEVARRKVPNMKKGGTVDRTEWVAYINW